MNPAELHQLAIPLASDSPTHLPYAEREHILPPRPRRRVEKVDPNTAAGPAPAFKVGLTVGFLGDDVLFLRILVDSEIVGPFDMGIHDGDHLGN